MAKEQKDLRSIGMLNLYDEGFTLQEISEKWGVTRERVRQILSESGSYKPRPRGGKRGAKYVPTPEECGKIIELARVNMAISKISKEIGIKHYYIRPVIKKEFSDQEYKNYIRTVKQHNGLNAGTNDGIKFTEQDFIDALVAASKDLGDTFGAERYDNWRRSQLNSEDYPSAVLFTQKKDYRAYGWSKYRELAGLPTNEIKSEKMGAAKFTDEELLRALKVVCDNHPDQIFPSLGTATKEMSSPSAASVRIRIGLGSWIKVEEVYNRWNN
jgi:hypothetical protein